MTLTPIAKASERELERAEIERLADTQAPAIAAAVRKALADQLDRIDLPALRDALERGAQAEVLALVGSLSDASAGAIRDALEDAVWAGGQFAQERPVLRRVEFRFDRVDPTLTRWMQGYGLNLIREIDNGTREAVRGALVQGLQQGAGPIDTARKVREAVGLTERQARAVQSYRKALETIHTKRSVASWGLGQDIDRVNGRQVFKPDADGSPTDGIDTFRLRDFRFDGVTARAQASGKPLKPEQIDRMVEAYQRKYLRHRSENIARTETIRALNAGAAESWRQAAASGKLNAALVRRFWVVARDERLCPRCRAIPKLNPKGVGLNEPFRTSTGQIMAPPEHPSCRCSQTFRILEANQPVLR